MSNHLCLALPIMGSRIPNVGTGKARKAKPGQDDQRTGLADALFTSTQQRVLGLLFGQADRSFAVGELIRLADSGSGSVQRALDRVIQSGIANVVVKDGRKRIQANAGSPIFHELAGIVAKTSGISAQLRTALRPAEDRILLAVLFGSVAKGTDSSSSDIDLLLVSDDLTQEAVYAMLEPTEARIGRRIEPVILTRKEFQQRRQSRHPFLTRVLTGKHEVLIGSEDALATG